MPRFADVKRRLEREGWTLLRTTNHYYFERVEPDGTVRRTKVSLALHKEVPAPVLRQILKQTGWERV